MTDLAKMHLILDLLTVDEIKDCLQFVAVCERGRHMSLVNCCT